MLIVGAGPVGLALAADLGSRGVPCLVVEQGKGRRSIRAPPRSTPARWSSCAAWAWPTRCATSARPTTFPHTALYCTTLTGFEIARIERPHHGGGGLDGRTARSGRSAATRSGSTRCCASCAVSYACVDHPATAAASRAARRARRPCGRDRARSRKRRAHRRSRRALRRRLQRRALADPPRARHRHERLVLSRLFHHRSSCARRNCGPTTAWARRR